MKRLALAAGGLTLAIALTGCGARTIAGTVSGDTVFGNAQELVRAAASKTEQAKTAKFTFEATAGGQTVKGTGSGRFESDNTAMQMTMDVGPVHEELRYVDKTMYIQLLPEQVRAQMTGGKPWGKLDPDSALAKTMGASANMNQNDPSKYLEQIQKAGTITRSEQTTLGGQPATHYWIDVDLAKAADMLAENGYPQEVLSRLQGKAGTIPLELWLNRDLLPVRITEDLGAEMKALGAPAEVQDMTMTMTYSDWGVPVDPVTAPPADQVGELKLGG